MKFPSSCGQNMQEAETPVNWEYKMMLGVWPRPTEFRERPCKDIDIGLGKFRNVKTKPEKRK